MLDIGGGTVARPVRSGGAWEAVVERPARHPRGRAIRLLVLIGGRVTKTHAVRGTMTALLKRTPTPRRWPKGRRETKKLLHALSVLPSCAASSVPFTAAPEGHVFRPRQRRRLGSVLKRLDIFGLSTNRKFRFLKVRLRGRRGGLSAGCRSAPRWDGSAVLGLLASRGYERVADQGPKSPDGALRGPPSAQRAALGVCYPSEDRKNPGAFSTQARRTQTPHSRRRAIRSSVQSILQFHNFEL